MWRITMRHILHTKSHLSQLTPSRHTLMTSNGAGKKSIVKRGTMGSYLLMTEMRVIQTLLYHYENKPLNRSKEGSHFLVRERHKGNSCRSLESNKTQLKRGTAAVPLLCLSHEKVTTPA